jgi:hypothetical protein
MFCVEERAVLRKCGILMVNCLTPGLKISEYGALVEK